MKLYSNSVNLFTYTMEIWHLVCHFDDFDISDNIYKKDNRICPLWEVKQLLLNSFAMTLIDVLLKVLHSINSNYFYITKNI